MTTRRLCRTILARSRSWLSRHPDTNEAIGFFLLLFVAAWVILTGRATNKKPTAADWARMGEETRARTAARARRGLA